MNALSIVALAFTANVAAADADWASYNRTLDSSRYATQSEITPGNAAKLTVLCTYDTGIETSFQTGPIVVDGTMYFTTEFETFAIGAGDCKEKWRVKEDYKPAGTLKVNRGAAFLDGRLFRGTQDGRVLAYDAATGKRLWEKQIAIPQKGETIPAAPIAWQGLVFAGNAGGDNFGVQGRMYALDATSGEVKWEFYLVPKAKGLADPAVPEGAAKADSSSAANAKASTWKNASDVPVAGGATWTSCTIDPDKGLLYVPGGNPAPDFVNSLRGGENLYTNSVVVLEAKTGKYVTHYQLVPEDFHDWDVSAAPALITAKSGKHLMAAAVKDGHLYIYDRDSGKRLARQPTTTIANADTKLTKQGTRFCPGTQGGTE